MRCRIIAVVADNARGIQLAINKFCVEFAVDGVRCAAHIFNLIGEDVYKKTPLKQALFDVERAIERGEVKRYCQTRWNSKYDAMNEALNKATFTDAERKRVQAGSCTMKVVATAIDIVQSRTSSV